MYGGGREASANAQAAYMAALAAGGAGPTAAAQEQLFLQRAAAANASLGLGAYGGPTSRLLYGPGAGASLLHRQAAMQRQLPTAANLPTRESLLRAQQQQQQHLQQHQQQQSSQQQQQQNKRRNSTPGEVIEIDDDSDEEVVAVEATSPKEGVSATTTATTTIDDKKRPKPSSSDATTTPDAAAAKRQKTAEKLRPLVIVQNWTREGLMAELGREEDERVRAILQSVYYHATGYTAMTAPTNAAFPPSNIELNIEKVHNIAKDVVADQREVLKRSIDVTFHKCAQLVRSGSKNDNVEMRLPQQKQGGGGGGDEVSGGLPPTSIATTTTSPVETTTHLGTTTSTSPSLPGGVGGGSSSVGLAETSVAVAAQKTEILRLKKALAVAEQKVIRERRLFEEEKSQLREEMKRIKTFHARSARACMIASVKSLRYMRESLLEDDDDDEDENENENKVAEKGGANNTTTNNSADEDDSDDDEENNNEKSAME